MNESVKTIIADSIRTLPSPLDRVPAEYKREYVRRKIREQAKNIPQRKVFGIGLSKTSTSSLAKALEVLGYESVSWNRNGKILGWPEFYLADAATDTPCCVQFESLYHTFEQSKFIYTVRELDDWVRSIRNHFELETPREFRQYWDREEFWQGDTRWKWHSDWQWQNAFRFIQIHQCLYAQHDTWKEAYRAYDQRVRQFFEDKPDHRFMVMNIPEGDGWDPLCSFLDREIPDRPFPHANPSRE
jgi:hypothetical protein